MDRRVIEEFTVAVQKTQANRNDDWKLVFLDATVAVQKTQANRNETGMEKKVQ